MLGGARLSGEGQESFPDFLVKWHILMYSAAVSQFIISVTAAFKICYRFMYPRTKLLKYKHLQQNAILDPQSLHVVNASIAIVPFCSLQNVEHYETSGAFAYYCNGNKQRPCNTFRLYDSTISKLFTAV